MMINNPLPPAFVAADDAATLKKEIVTKKVGPDRFVMENIAKPATAPIHPIAYRILVKPRKVERKTRGGIALPDDVVDKNTIVVQVGQVIEVGDSAFTSSDAFPGPRAPYGVGDWVVFAPHTGLQVIVEEDGERVEYRLMNDDHVLARADNPDIIKSTVL